MSNDKARGTGWARGEEDQLLGPEEVAGRVGVAKVTIWRWCREGRLPCIKAGKGWRVRRSALEDFLVSKERPVTLTGQLRSFITVPDNLMAIAQSPELLHRLDVAFLRVGEARGGKLVKFHGEEPETLDRLRDEYENLGFQARRLEAEGRLDFRTEPTPPSDRAEGLRRYLDEDVAVEAGRSVWVTFDWAESLDPQEAIAYQEAVAHLVNRRQLVVGTAVLEEVMNEWAPDLRRRSQLLHSGVVWLSEAGLALSCVTPPPPD